MKKNSLDVSLVPVKKSVIGRIRDVIEIVAYTFRFEERDSQNNFPSLRIRQQHLLSRTSSDYVSIKQASTITGMSESSIRHLASQERIEALKVHNRWLVLLDSVRGYLEERDK